jgi:cell division protein FtsL
MILRTLNVFAVAALLGSAVYAYTVKYETIFFSEQISKLKNGNHREREAIAVLRAEWAHLVRPTRIQALADQHLDLKQLSVDQIVQVMDLPDRAPKVDSIGRKLELLGLAEPTSTPRDDKPRGPAPGAASGMTTGAIPAARRPQEPVR